jgi:hypothetical protein
MRKAIQSGSTLDTARILGSNEFLALHSKQRAYIALFGFYSALYSHTGEKVLERITSHGLPRNEHALELLFGQPIKSPGLDTAAFQTALEALPETIRSTITMCMFAVNDAVRDGNAFNSPVTQNSMHMYMKLGSRNPTLTALPTLTVTRGAIDAFVKHVDGYSQTVREIIAQDATSTEPLGLAARKNEIMRWTLINNLLPFASHAQGVEALYAEDTQRMLEDPSPLVLCQDKKGHLYVTRQAKATELNIQIVRILGENNNLGLRFGCPLFYHPLLKKMVDACAEYESNRI